MYMEDLYVLENIVCYLQEEKRGHQIPAGISVPARVEKEEVALEKVFRPLIGREIRDVVPAHVVLSKIAQDFAELVANIVAQIERDVGKFVVVVNNNAEASSAKHVTTLIILVNFEVEILKFSGEIVRDG